ncbi:hypothetical protein KPL70_020569 [Citrus sinensis]|nr:hypothetical protein KPL70_020569 [Citrus sinensis]
MKKSLENRLYMKKKLFRFTYALGMSMNDHVNSFNKILAYLLNLDERFEDEDKALLLLNSLPDEYDHLTTTLLHGKDSVTFDVVCSALYNSETRKKDRKDHRDTVAKALTAKGRSQSRKPRKRSKSKGRPAKDECAFCCEKEHWKKNCPKLQKVKANSDACVVEHGEDSDFSLVGMTLICHSNEWILDSGCTYHMCPNEGWFLTSKSWTVELFLRAMTMLVVASALTVMKGTRRNNLYYFQGSIVIGSASTVSGKDAYSEATKLWHMRLGHVGEKALQTLVKQGLLKGANSCKLKFCEHCVLGKQTREKFGSCTLSNAGLGKEFWAETVVYACHLINRLPSTAIEGKTPIEMWIGNPATDYDSLHVFSSTAYYHLKESKLDPRAKKVLFVGITGRVKGYRLWCPIRKNIIFSKDVTFTESAMLKQKDSQEDDKTSSTLQQVEFEKIKSDPADVDETNSDSPSTEDDEEVLTQEPSQQQELIAYRRSHTEICRPARFVDMVAYALPIIDDDVPSTYREAVSNLESIQWKKAMNEEMQSLYKNETWELDALPKEKKAIGCKWVYAKKEGFPCKNEIRYKARLVANGYAQKEGINYNEGDLEEKIYMTQPDGFKTEKAETGGWFVDSRLRF